MLHRQLKRFIGCHHLFSPPPWPYHMHAPVSHPVSSCQFPLFYALQSVWGDPARLVMVKWLPTTIGAGHVTLLQYFKLPWLLRWSARFIVSVVDCKLYENTVSLRSPQTTVVSLDEWLPLHSPLFSLLTKEFVVPWTWAGRWQSLSRPSHTFFSLFDQWEVIQQPMRRLYPHFSQ